MYWLVYAVLLLAPACRHAAAPTGASACTDSSKINSQGICTMEHDPVCGCDGKMYSNSNPCAARNAGVRTYTSGPCPAAAPK